MDGKTKAIISHITWIGWVIALVTNNQEKDELTSFYIRQTLGIHLVSVAAVMVPKVGFVLGLAALVFWVISLIGSLQGEMKSVPVLGDYFQDWFSGL